MDKPWLKHYPKGVPAEIDVSRYGSINEIFDESVHKFRDRAAFVNMGTEITYEDLNYMSADFASFLQNVAGLKAGDRIAIQMPNVLQYPIALFGILRAGMVVVNCNPLYTAREMKHQLKDSGAKAIVILANSAHHLEEIIDETDIKTVIVTEVGELLGFPKSVIVNSVIKYVKKMVPKYNLPQAYSFYEALDLGAEKSFRPVNRRPEDHAFLQYTGGTTGISKGAILTHRNIVANMLQIAEWIRPRLVEGEEVALLALPLYHIFSLTVNGLTILYYGGTNVMITNPRDIPAFIKTMRKTPFTVFPGLNTLYNALMNHPDFGKIDFRGVKVSVAGGMALQKSVAERWMKLTKSLIIEGYGLTETSPVACVNPVDGTDKVGTIGLPISSTEVQLFDDSGRPVKHGETGEIWIRGPQVMQGYWQKPEETAQILTPDGWLKTGDIGVMDDEGFIKIVDRKKDMILVSGFNVYPNEIEDVVASHPKVLEVAAVGVPDEHSTEAVKIFVVPKDTSLTKEELVAFCKENLTGYKVPRHVEFRKELPKTNVGKILRRELRDQH
ncbi:MAG: AMP-binding protein [Calothrix sp. SM1_5_4]|nr:AMP-binding protein [Calothrix sp. SM1_5_4]